MTEARPVQPPHPPLHDGDVTLRPFHEDDAEAVARACRDPEIRRWIPTIPEPYTIDDAVTFIERVERDWGEGHAAAFAIVGHWRAPGARPGGRAPRCGSCHPLGDARWASSGSPYTRSRGTSDRRSW